MVPLLPLLCNLENKLDLAENFLLILDILRLLMGEMLIKEKNLDGGIVVLVQFEIKKYPVLCWVHQRQAGLLSNVEIFYTVF